MFTVRYDAASHCLRINLRGFWGPEQVAALGAEVKKRGAEAYARGPDFDTIVESFDFPVQGTVVADQLGKLTSKLLPEKGGHVAIVVGSQLNKSQAQRTLVHPRLRVFRETDAAQIWLSEQRKISA